MGFFIVIRFIATVSRAKMLTVDEHLKIRDVMSRGYKKCGKCEPRLNSKAKAGENMSTLLNAQEEMLAVISDTL